MSSVSSCLGALPLDSVQLTPCMCLPGMICESSPKKLRSNIGSKT